MPLTSHILPRHHKRLTYVHEGCARAVCNATGHGSDVKRVTAPSPSSPGIRPLHNMGRERSRAIDATQWQRAATGSWQQTPIPTTCNGWAEMDCKTPPTSRYQSSQPLLIDCFSDSRMATVEPHGLPTAGRPLSPLPTSYEVGSSTVGRKLPQRSSIRQQHGHPAT